MEQPARRDRRGQQQPQIVGQEERRERGDDAAEGQEREERQEQPRQAEAEQVVAELGVLDELPGEPERRPRDSARDHDQRRSPPNSDAAQQVAALAPARAVARRPERRQQQVGERLCSCQTISSISCSPLPPVSFRNTARQLRRPRRPPASARSSATVPRAMIRPFRMMLMRSHISCGDFERVRAHQDRDAVLAHAAEDVLDQPRAARVEADHRLVDQHRPRPVQERRAHHQPLLHAVREALDQLVLPARELEELEHLA